MPWALFALIGAYCKQKKPGLSPGGKACTLCLKKAGDLIGRMYADHALGGFAPVSYTHLDVYKRQTYIGKNKICGSVHVGC